MNDFLQITFSINCISKAKESGVTIDDLVMILTKGIIRRLQGGHLSFLYKGVEVITCDSAIVAIDLIVHKIDEHHHLGLNTKCVESFYYAHL